MPQRQKYTNLLLLRQTLQHEVYSFRSSLNFILSVLEGGGVQVLGYTGSFPAALKVGHRSTPSCKQGSMFHAAAAFAICIAPALNFIDWIEIMINNKAVDR
jgi:hypothetical protein